MIICETTFNWPFDLNGQISVIQTLTFGLVLNQKITKKTEGDEDDQYDEDEEDNYLSFDFWLTFVLLSLLHDNEIGEASPLVGLEGI